MNHGRTVFDPGRTRSSRGNLGAVRAKREEEGERDNGIIARPMKRGTSARPDFVPFD